MNTRIVGDAAHLQDFLPVYTDKNVQSAYFSSPESMASYCSAIDESKAWKSTPHAWDTGRTAERFTGSRDIGHALQMCREGWPDGAERAAKLRDRINAANPMGPRMIRYDVAGAYPSVPRALAGNPLNMRRIDSARLRRRPVLTLLSDVSVSFMIDGKALEYRAAVVAAVVDAIEAAGFSCQLITTFTTKANGVASSCSVEVKESSAPADIGRLAFSLGHPAFFRRMGWSVIVETPFTQDIGQALGYPQQAKASDAMKALGVYVLPSVNNNASAFGTEEAAATRGLKYIIDSLATQGCPAFPQESSDAA